MRRFRQLVARSPIRRQGVGQLFRQAGIARVGHVQPVVTDGGSRRELLGTIPFLHDLKSAKQSDLSASRNFRNQTLHLVRGRAREHPRSVLEVHQDYIDPALFHCGYAAAYELFIRREIVTPEHRISADLPDHQIRVLGNHVPAETGQFLRNVLTAYTVIDDPDLDAGKLLSQFLLEFPDKMRDEVRSNAASIAETAGGAAQFGGTGVAVASGKAGLLEAKPMATAAAKRPMAGIAVIGARLE